MPDLDDLQFAQSALTQGLVDKGGLIEALALQEQAAALGYGHSLVEVLKQQGAIDRGKMEELARKQRLTRALEGEKLYGEIAVKNAFVGREQVEACLRQQKARDFQVQLGELLQEGGFLTPEQHEAIVKVQSRILGQRARQFVQHFAKAHLGGEARAPAEIILEPGEPAPPPAPAAPPAPTEPAQPLEVDADIAGGHVPRDFIPGYHIESLLGQGAMGLVFKATQIALGRTVAIKVLLAEWAQDQEFVERFKREARVAATLNQPNVMQVYDFGQVGPHYYLAVEYITGRTVQQHLDEKQVLSEQEALTIVMHVTKALQAVAEQHIVHRDIKPGNIMITDKGEVKLTDLGLAKRSATDESGQSMSLTTGGTTIGTPGYMSPEQARGDKLIDSRADIYSLGATLYHMVTGYIPYHDSQSPIELASRHIMDPPPDAKLTNPKVSGVTQRLILHMMQKKLEDRYASPDELMNDLLEIKRGGSPNQRFKPAGSGRVPVKHKA